jgi:hypothetical protein
MYEGIGEEITVVLLIMRRRCKIGLFRLVPEVVGRCVGVVEVWKAPSPVFSMSLSVKEIPPRERIMVVDKNLNLSKKAS